MGKRLITDRDVQEGRVSSPLRLDGQTLITPSARDRCARLGIEVLEPGSEACPRCGGASCGGCGAGGGRSAPAASCGLSRSAGSHSVAGLGALPDGLYLVRVSGGRLASILPAAGPGALPVARDAGGRGP